MEKCTQVFTSSLLGSVVHRKLIIVDYWLTQAPAAMSREFLQIQLLLSAQKRHQSSGKDHVQLFCSACRGQTSLTGFRSHLKAVFTGKN